MNPTNCCGEEVCWEFKAQAVDSNLLLWGSIFSAGQTWAVADLNFPVENQQQSLCFLSQRDEGWVSICEELRRITDMSRSRGYKWLSALFMRKSAVPTPSPGHGSCCLAHRCFSYWWFNDSNNYQLSSFSSWNTTWEIQAPSLPSLEMSDSAEVWMHNFSMWWRLGKSPGMTESTSGLPVRLTDSSFSFGNLSKLAKSWSGKQHIVCKQRMASLLPRPK